MIRENNITIKSFASNNLSFYANYHQKSFFTQHCILCLAISLFAQNKEPKTIVLIHGLFQNSYSWANWKKYFEERDYKVYTPSYPYHEGNPKNLNKHINEELINLDFKEVLAFMTSFVDSFPEKPIIIGNSMGGLLMQKLVEAEKAYMA